MFPSHGWKPFQFYFDRNQKWLKSRCKYLKKKSGHTLACYGYLISVLRLFCEYYETWRKRKHWAKAIWFNVSTVKDNGQNGNENTEKDLINIRIAALLDNRFTILYAFSIRCVCVCIMLCFFLFLTMSPHINNTYIPWANHIHICVGLKGRQTKIDKNK